MFCHFLPRVARDRNEEARENYARRGVYMSVLHMKLISPPMYIQHNPCRVRADASQRDELCGHKLLRQRYTLKTQQGDLTMSSMVSGFNLQKTFVGLAT